MFTENEKTFEFFPIKHVVQIENDYILNLNFNRPRVRIEGTVEFMQKDNIKNKITSF
jgi:hypothetical protein